MKSVRVSAPNALEIVDVQEPDGAHEVLVRSQIVGICGTDVKVLTGKIPVAYPRIMGHEMVGEVVSAPPGVHVTPGDRVLIDPGSACGLCHLCRRGRGNLCINAGLMGREVDGVFADLVAVPARQVLPVPNAISSLASGLLQVLGTCVHAQRSIDVFPGQTALVIGLGVAGQLMAQLLRERGIDVIGVTRSEWKRELAERNGVTATATPDDAQSVLARHTDGRGADIVVEAVGKERTLAQAIDLAATGGEVVVFGTLTGGDEGLPYYQLYFKELTITNPRGALPDDYARGIELAASGRLELESIVTHQLTLDDASEAFDLVHDASSLKVLMHVG